MKRFAAFVLSVFMTFSGTNIIFAENSIPEALEQAILSVKDRLDISEEYSEFEYSIHNYDEKEKYSLTWSKPGTLVGADTKEKVYNNDEIVVNIDAGGNIFSYTHWNDDSQKSTIVDKKSREECLNAAQNFLKMVLPNNYSEFRFEKDLSANDQFVFRQYKGDIPVRFNTVNILINNVSLNVERFYFENADYLKKDFGNSEGVMDLEKAITEFSNKISIEPEYIFKYDYKTKDKKVFIAYRPKELFYNKALDAKTGDLIENRTYNDGEYTRASGVADATSNLSAKEEDYDSGLSEQEVAKIEEAKGLISEEDADREIKNLLPEGVKLGEKQSAQLKKDRIDGKYVWDIDYENGYAAYDAANKKLIRFYSYKDMSEVVKDMPEEVADADKINFDDYDNFLASRKAEAEEYIKKVAPDKIDSVEFLEKYSKPYDLIFVRKVNGLSFSENAVKVEFDNNGKIKAYYCDWYNSVEFPEPNNLLPASDIIKKFKDLAGFGLTYELGRKIGSPAEELKLEISGQTPKEDVILSYSFINLGVRAPLISAQTGQEINYDGTDFKGILDIPESYADISDHWCEKYVNALLNSGIYIKHSEDNKNFLPNNEITKNQLFEFYGNFYDDDIEEVLKDKNEPITKKELCKIISMFFKYVNIAEKDIFKNPFNDVDDNDADLGTMAIANALDILTVDKDGNFNPNKYITNAEAAKVLYMLEALK